MIKRSINASSKKMQYKTDDMYEAHFNNDNSRLRYVFRWIPTSRECGNYHEISIILQYRIDITSWNEFLTTNSCCARTLQVPHKMSQTRKTRYPAYFMTDWKKKKNDVDIRRLIWRTLRPPGCDLTECTGNHENGCRCVHRGEACTNLRYRRRKMTGRASRVHNQYARQCNNCHALSIPCCWKKLYLQINS